jgi:serine/threonine protein kinase
MHIEDDQIVWATRVALECRRRVKEQQKRIGQAEFGNTAFSFSLDGSAEEFVTAADFRALGEDSDAPAVPTVPPPPANKQLSAIKFYNVGDVIDDRFEVEAHLGDGGFSSVYRVRDKLEGVSRALKVFATRGAEDALKREIGFLRLVDHPNVVRVIWADRTSDGQSYLVSELVEGKSLDDYVRGGEQLSDEEAVKAVLQLLDALAAIHPDQARVDAIRAGEISEDDLAELQELQHVGVVHRDVKPNNIILTPKGIKLLDFNIASRVGDPVVTLSGTGPYQAPDADYTNWDVSTDLFAAGVVLYELLCGEHPYDDDRPRIDAFPADPRQFRSDLSAEMSEFLMKATAPDRELRFRSAREMREALATL